MKQNNKMKSELKLVKQIDKINLYVDECVEKYIPILNSQDNWINFTIETVESINSILSKYRGKTGIYYIEINFRKTLQKLVSIEEITEELSANWSKEGEKQKRPSIIEKRVHSYDAKSYNSEEWVGFYLGKSNNLESRLNQHLLGSGSESTYKLDLKGITNKIFLNSEFRIKVIEVKELSDSKYYWVIQRIESCLREKCKPICGKQ